jgi:hypothetical protein
MLDDDIFIQNESKDVFIFCLKGAIEYRVFNQEYQGVQYEKSNKSLRELLATVESLPTDSQLFDKIDKLRAKGHAGVWVDDFFTIIEHFGINGDIPVNSKDMLNWLNEITDKHLNTAVH